MQNLFMKSSASLSDCGRYRYNLFREWDERLPRCLFVMFNPSTAAALEDDPTIRRCLHFASKLGCGSLTVVNLFALRATNPAELLTAADPIGPENDTNIELCARAADRIIAAWGACKLPRCATDRAEQVLRLLAGKRVECLGLTKSGRPRHPLYLGNGVEAVQYDFLDLGNRR